MSDMITTRADDEAKLSDRRLFLSSSGLALALLAIAGAESPAVARTLSVPKIELMPTTAGGPHAVAVPSTAIHAVNQVLLAASQTGSLNTQSAAYLSLTPAVQQAVASIPPSIYGQLQSGCLAVVNALQAPAGTQIGIGLIPTP